MDGGLSFFQSIEDVLKGNEPPRRLNGLLHRVCNPLPCLGLAGLHVQCHIGHFLCDQLGKAPVFRPFPVIFVPMRPAIVALSFRICSRSGSVRRISTCSTLSSIGMLIFPVAPCCVYKLYPCGRRLQAKQIPQKRLDTFRFIMEPACI